jgi:hypothetical protein
MGAWEGDDGVPPSVPAFGSTPRRPRGCMAITKLHSRCAEMKKRFERSADVPAASDMRSVRRSSAASARAIAAANFGSVLMTGRFVSEFLASSVHGAIRQACVCAVDGVRSG